MNHTSKAVGTSIEVEEIGEGYTMFIDDESGAAITSDTVIDLAEAN